MALSDEAFDELMNAAVAEITVKQERLARQYGFDQALGPAYSDETQTLHLFDAADRPIAEADVVEIAYYNAQARAWLWSWAKPDVAAGARARSETLKALTEATGAPVFSAARAVRLPDEAMAWRLAAMAAQHLQAMGVHRLAMPDGSQMAFLAIMSVRDLRGANGYGWSSRA